LIPCRGVRRLLVLTFISVLRYRRKILVKVNHKSLVKPLVLQRAPWMAAQHRKRVLRLIRMLPEVTVDRCRVPDLSVSGDNFDWWTLTLTIRLR
jgi:hypothetical protein